MRRGSTLCWDCTWATKAGHCPYMDDGEPVEGWWASENTITYRDRCRPDREFKSYNVIMCPKFFRNSWRSGLYPFDGREERIRLKEDSAEEIKGLVAAIILRAVSDWKSLNNGQLKNSTANDGEMVYRFELIEFFNSKRFAAMLSLVAEHSPDQIREVLKVPSV